MIGFRRSPASRAVAFIVAVFVVTRIALVLLGVRFDLEWITLSIQNVDSRLLQSRLWQSLWYLHGQPPLWNALEGIVLQAGSTVWPRVWHAVFVGLGLIEALALYALLRELRTGRWTAAIVAAAFSLTPAVLVYENLFTYDYPTLVLLTLAALSAGWFVHKPGLGRGLALFGAAGALVLMRTIFQWPWLVLLAALMLIACPSHRRVVVLSCAMPLALVGAVIAKNWVMYGVPSTTSWSGMMLARSAENALPMSERRRLVAEGKLHVVSLVPPLSDLQSYEAVGIKRARATGVPMLDEPGDIYFPRNFENKTFIHISRLYLQDDLWIMRHRTGAYLHSVGRGVADFFAPPTIDLHDPGRNTEKIRGYDRWFNRLVYGRLGPGKDGLFLIALYAFTFIVAIFVTARRLRPGADAATVIVAFSLLVMIYLGVVGNLAEVGENYRFRLYLDPLVLAVATFGVNRLRTVRDCKI